MDPYEPFAEHFARTRANPWLFLEKFIQKSIPQDFERAINWGADFGCGIGQNAVLMNTLTNKALGVDLSWSLLQFAKDQYDCRVHCDLSFLPFRGDVFHYCQCVAVLHSIMGRSSRAQALAEIARVMKKGGYCFVTVGKRWHPRFRKYFLHEGLQNAASYFPAGDGDFGDIDLGWKEPSTGTRYPRFCHFFSEGEFRDLLVPLKILNFKRVGRKKRKDNYAAFVQKF
ncbi:MAG TPA: class I SAM-dependent methyltransferase [Candidatus Lokiarchaeia archaeon]|nr:class I SAM-dependent methyltransferase [Candidatus Lokiarchaeia archaeon]